MNKLTFGLIVAGLVALQTPLVSQEANWKTQKTKDGQTTVSSLVSQRVDDTGTKVLVLEFQATTTATADWARCVAVLKDLGKHAKIVDAKESVRVSTLSDNEWGIYYNFNAPWPLPGSDLAATMVIAEDPDRGSAVFTVTASPTLVPLKKDVTRMRYYQTSYSFQDLGGGKVEVTTKGRMSPAIQVPEWMIQGYFPEGPADIHKIILGLAK